MLVCFFKLIEPYLGNAGMDRLPGRGSWHEGGAFCIFFFLCGDASAAVFFFLLSLPLFAGLVALEPCTVLSFSYMVIILLEI